jgi:pyruvate,water dikinase
VQIPTIIKVQDFHSYPQSAIGQLALVKQKLNKNQIPLAPTFCIPINTLEKIAKYNQLPAKILDLQTRIKIDDQAMLDRLLKKVKTLITYQKLPKRISLQLLKFHDLEIKNNFLNIYPSYIKQEINREKLVHKNIIGESNMLDSILNLWAESLTQKDLEKNNIFPAAIILEIKFQAKVAGLAYTLNPQNANKRQILIKSIWGNFHHSILENEGDSFVLDQNNWEIIYKNIKQQFFYTERISDRLEEKKLKKEKQKISSLTDVEAINLAQIVQKIKRLNLKHLVISWYKANHKYYISDVHSYQLQTKIEDYLQLPIALGKTINHGLIIGQAKFIDKASALNDIKTDDIIILEKLDHSFLNQLSKTAAIICETGISTPSILQAIKQAQIPCLTQVKSARKKISNGMKILLDANHGKVFPHKYPFKEEKQQQQPLLNEFSKQTNLKLYLSASVTELDKLDQLADGIGLLKSESLFLQTGEHPLHLIRKCREDQIKKTFINQIKTLATKITQRDYPVIYRIQTLNSQELNSLKHADNFEVKEDNPHLGLRGSIKTVHNFEIFDFELDLIREAQKILPQIKIMLAFVRTAAELQLILKHVQHSSKDKYRQIPICLEIDTIENILNLKYYLRQKLAAISINVEEINALIYGIDPCNHEIKKFYPIDIPLLETLLLEIAQAKKEVLEMTDQRIPEIYLHLPEANAELIDIASKLNFTAITIESKFSSSAKKCIIEIEEFTKKNS